MVTRCMFAWRRFERNAGLNTALGKKMRRREERAKKKADKAITVYEGNSDEEEEVKREKERLAKEEEVKRERRPCVWVSLSLVFCSSVYPSPNRIVWLL
jgi:hypothetical protein